MDLKKEVVAIVGSTGDIMSQVVYKLAKDNYDFILINRSLKKSLDQRNEINKINPKSNVEIVNCDLSSIDSVKNATNQLLNMNFNYLILGGGLLSNDKTKLELGYNTIFQVNFISQYYLTRSLALAKDFKIIVVSSLSYKWAKANCNDIDYSLYNNKSKIYGNAKRFLTISLLDEFKDRTVATHPGIVKTKMTTNYNKLLRPFISFFMTILFPRAKKASRNITMSLCLEPQEMMIFGPKIFNVWGKPKFKKIKDVTKDENELIMSTSLNIYQKVKEFNSL